MRQQARFPGCKSDTPFDMPTLQTLARLQHSAPGAICLRYRGSLLPARRPLFHGQLGALAPFSP